MNILLQTLKDNLTPSELTGLDKENYPCLYPESKQAKNNKGNRCWECMPCCYWSLFIFFNQRCIEALVKSKRQSLDAIKRRMQAASKHSKDSGELDAKSPALFKVNGSLVTLVSLKLSRSHHFPLPRFFFQPILLSNRLSSLPLVFSLYTAFGSCHVLSSVSPSSHAFINLSVRCFPCLHSCLVCNHCFLYFHLSPFSCLFPPFHFLTFLVSFIPGGYCFRDPINSNEAKFG